MTTDASRFYYLRLMSKRRSSADAGSIKLSKPKFAQWSKDALERTPVLDEDPELESQAIRIVRTIGQAFEVCHKINTEQNDEVEEEEEADDEGSREPPAAGPRTLLQGYVLQSAAPAEQSSSSASSGATKYGLPGSSAGVSDKSPSIASIPSSNIPVVPPAASSQQQQQQQPIRMIPGQQAAFGGLPVAVAGPSQMPTEGGVPGAVVCTPQVSAAQQQQQPGFPYSQTWSGALPYNSMGRETSDFPTSSVRGLFPFNISSPPAGFFSPERISSPMPLSAAPCVPDPGAPSTSQPTTLGRAMENFNLTVLRAQLDQAQQQAQVAIAQVNLLREQLSVETTARLESQSRTQQLLMANKELIEQVHSLVSRLQMLETRIVGASTNPNIPTLLVNIFTVLHVHRLTICSSSNSSELDITTKYAAALSAMAQQYAERGISSPVKYGSKKELNVFVSPAVSKYGGRQSPPVATGRRTGPAPVSKLARAITVSSFDQRLKGLPKAGVERFESIPPREKATRAHASVTELKELPKETPTEKVAVEASSSPVRFGSNTLRTVGSAKMASATESPIGGHVNKARHPLKLVKKQITSDNLLLSKKLDPSLLAALGNRLPVVENHIGSAGRTENESRLTALLGGPKVVPPLATEELRKQGVHKAPLHEFALKQRLSDPSVVSSTTSDQNHGNKGGGGDQTAQAAQASAHGNR
ncbi:carboxyl terminal PDZ ligand of neuronal nitric [Trichuris trichiura]|uniref:Carboxyl terminal PDZ ligand of neuronal nitric n=1 Tax=Trichuris trichiura TaxID=36087 RepID=A0A077YYH7_TRITR|nr:carboxyl terminal PDZ ligand of neuronal nitric [Trichuris trichiura]